MNMATAHNWYEANQRALSSALASVRHALELYLEKKNVGTQSIAPEDASQNEKLARTFAMLPIADPSNSDAELISGPSALEALCTTFALSPFERDVLLLCAGIELDKNFAPLCAAAQGDAQRNYPTFSLALAALPDAHWSALTPNAPLRRWRLLEMSSGSSLTVNLLHIDERILHYLVGIQHLDERLVGMVEPLRPSSQLVPSHRTIAEQLVITWSRSANTTALPVVQLCGDDLASKRVIAAAACQALELNPYSMPAHAIPASPNEFEAFMRLWEREAALSSATLFVDCDAVEASDAVLERGISRLIEAARGIVIVSSRLRRHAVQRPMITFEVHKPTPGEQRTIWQSVLGDTQRNLNGKVDMLVAQFSLSPATIVAAGNEALGRLVQVDEQETEVGIDLGEMLWESCRVQARPRLDDLAQRIEPYAGWDDLVLPELQKQVLHDVAAYVRQRTKVYETWGFATKGARGLGISALFAGTSGTGKTMAAEVLANELRLDLYRIDLSQVVSKYIGETEKNLRRVFDAAEEGGAILLFDEADALFGKRSEVKDSHDRYANIEVSYLLQRMEAYRGLAILTTNMKSALDTAFLRRLRFIVQFPFPDAAQRAEIWRRIFPANLPTENLDMTRLARLNVTGGNIRNIALHAAFLAADAGEPVRMTHLLRAARSEYTKLEKSLTEAEIGGWI